MNRNVSLVLENILVNKLDKYLRLEANELIFNKPCEINIDYGTHWETIEDEELREQIKGAGIGTSATRAEIIKKLERINYISINTKTQIITPTEKRRKNI